MATIFSQRSWLLCLLAIFLSHGFKHIEASHKVFRNLESLSVQSTSSVKQPYRTSYHFQPPQNWINDPNGPMVYKGLYHLFYQYNPKGAVWGNIVWAHSTSTDLINWTPHDPAIYPSEPFDQNGCWSGSATIHPKLGPIILYTGINPKNQQVQNLAKPKNASDPFLIEWVKPTDINPLMAPTVQNGINASSFRDPTEAWVGPDGVWRTIIGSKNHRTGLAILYRSRDFLRWEKADRPLHSVEGTGMWECPDFFPVATKGKHGVDTSTLRGVKHVFKVSLDDTKHEYYTVGSYDPKKDVYVPDHGSIESDAGLRYDYGKFYASKTFFDSIQKRRILWGWINESSSVPDDVKKGWAGVQAIPRTILLEKSGKQLVQWPVTEIKKLRHNQVKYFNKPLKAGSKFEVSRVTPSKADVDISFKVGGLEKADVLDPSWTNPQILCSKKSASVKGSLGPFGLLTLASKGLEEYTAVFFRIFRSHNNKYVVLMCSDQSRSSLNKDNDKTTYGAFVNVDPVHETISLRSLIDNSIVESFGGKGKAVITARVYPKRAIGSDAKLYAFNYGSQDVKITSLKAWSMKKADLNGDK